MPNKRHLDINIINIQQSGKTDSSSYHLAHIIFDVNDKKFEMDEYIDSIHNAIVTQAIKPSESVAGNDKTSLLFEMSVKLYLDDDECKALFAQIARKINIIINESVTFRKIFPPLSELMAVGFSHGFSFHAMTPKFHLSKIECDGREQHICTASIRTLVQELDDYAAGEGVTESYSYHELALQRVGYPDFFIAVNKAGNGWIIYWWGKEAGQYLPRKVDTLRDLASEIRFRKARSPYG
ncbi:MAG TPA: hypothetical protein VIF10_10540 [Methylobacter sp.]|jgi:hypothetical protein